MTASDPAEILATLRAAVEGHAELPQGASALRLRVRLQPAGGPGAKVMPPTYSGPQGPVYVTEDRVVDGEVLPCVSLDSVASQANRLELALSQEIEDGRVRIPTVWVDQAEFGVHSALDFSHRCFDAWVEDALLGETRFGDTDLWVDIAGAQRRSLGALMARSPSAILFGCWASRVKNPQGSARLARILSSEIVAVGSHPGQRAASKIDIHPVSRGVDVYEAGEGQGRITLNPEHAAREKDKPKPFPGTQPGRPSSAGYGNVAPSVATHGGISMRYGLQIATVSLPALRECRFPDDGDRRVERDVAGRLMLAALALRLLALQVERGYDLRSGCLLIPAEEPTVELLDRVGGVAATWALAEAPTQAVLAGAIDVGRGEGISWDGEEVSLKASPAQLQLLRQSLVQAPAEES